MNIRYKDQSLGSGGGGAQIPAGVVWIWGRAAGDIPDGWALCDGQDGRPDLRDRFVLGAGLSYAAGETGGEATHKLTVSEMPSHSHSIGTQGNSGSYNAIYGGKTTSNTLTTTLSAGGNAAHNNMPPYYALCYIIKL